MSAKPYEVKCPTYTKQFKTQADAERWIAGVEKLAACPHPHLSVEVEPCKPRT